MTTPSGRIAPKPQKKEPTHWTPGAPVRQSVNGCNSAALLVWMQCQPNNRTNLSLEYADKHWLEPARTPHGSLLKDVLQAAKDHGDISDFDYWTEPANRELKERLKSGPVIVGHKFWSLMYARGEKGVIQVGGDLVGGHTWTCIGWNPNQKKFSFISSWGDNRPYGILSADMAELMDDETAEIAIPIL